MAVLQVIQDIQEFQESKMLRKAAEEAAKAISFDGDIDVLTSWLFRIFCQIGKGIQYVYEQFGAVADHFYIAEERLPNPLNGDEGGEGYVIQYMPDLFAVITDYKYLGMMCLGMIRNSLYGITHLEYQEKVYYVQMEDFLFLAGVEEAHHAYFHKSGGSFEGEYRTREEYRNHPAEMAVAPVIRQAVRELNIQVYKVEAGKGVPCALQKKRIIDDPQLCAQCHSFALRARSEFSFSAIQ